MATERIQIVVSSTGTVTVKRELDSVASSAKKAGDGVNYLKGLITSLVTGYAVQQLFQLADAGTALSNSLKVAGLEGQDFINTQNDLFTIAKDNGQNVNELAGIYQRLNSVQGQLGIGQDDIIEALRNISAGFKISSSSAQAQTGALQQLQQLLGGTVVQMQEVNSLVDGAFPILQAVARGTDEFSGNVGALINRLRQGGYSVKEFFDGLQKGSDINRNLAETWNLSIGQALTNFRTNLIQTVLELNQATGIFTIFAKVIDIVGNNLGLVTALVSPFIAALTILAVQIIGGAVISAFATLYSTLAAFATFLFSTLIPAIARLTVVLLTNPFFAAATAAVVIGIIAYRKELQGMVGDIENTITGLGNLKGAIPGLKEGRIQFDATQAADQITGAGTGAGTEIGNKMKDAGAVAGDLIARGMTNAALTNEQLAQDAQARAIANYEALNGRVQAATAATLIDGGKYLYNSITGSITKATPTMQEGIQSGGNAAATMMHDAIVSAGSLVAQTWQAREARILAAQQGGAILTGSPEALQQYRDATHDLGGFYNDNKPVQIIQYGPADDGSNDNWNNNRSRGDSDRRSTQSGVTVGVTNLLDPAMMPFAMGSKAGQSETVNTIRANREEIQAILGIV